MSRLVTDTTWSARAFQSQEQMETLSLAMAEGGLGGVPYPSSSAPCPLADGRTLETRPLMPSSSCFKSALSEVSQQLIFSGETEALRVATGAGSTTHRGWDVDLHSVFGAQMGSDPKSVQHGPCGDSSEPGWWGVLSFGGSGGGALRAGALRGRASGGSREGGRH